MIIIAGTATYTGISTIRQTNRTKFNAELKVIHTKVDEIAEEELSQAELAAYGNDIEAQTGEIQMKIQTALSGGSSEGFRYFEKQDLEKIGVSGIDRQVIINFTTREVVDIKGCKTNEGHIYRMEGWQPIEYQNPNINAPTFNLSKKNYGLNASIEVTNIEYKNDVAKGTIKYAEVVGGTPQSWKSGSTSIKIEKTGTYRVQITDAAGNVAEKDIEVAIANKPSLVQGMEPIIYNEETKSWDVIEETNGNWYDYASDSKQWANVRTKAKTANLDGTYNEAQWVWIPRYAYQVPEKPTSTENSGAPEFKISFLKGTTNVPVNEAYLGGSSIKLDTSGEVAPGDWVVHPAFKFGDQELTGIWVAKFEASSNAPNTVADGGGDTTEYQINVKPSVPSWRNITASNMFDVCRNMTATTGALEGMHRTDPHMMKNVEWGAVVYLTQSKHGKNGQVWNNPYYECIEVAWNNPNLSVSNNDIILTGKAATAANAADAKNTTACDSYNTGNGPEASTTGTVYGVYDMAGGSWEYTAAYVNNSSAQSSTYITNIRTVVENPATEKYVDVYDATTDDTKPANYTENANKYGDAVYETSYAGSENTSWQKDYSYFPYSRYPVFARGGDYLDGTDAGVFSFKGYNGNGVSYISFRPVCLPL